MRSSIFVTLAALRLASAHFILQHPESSHFSDDTEDQAPCGGKIPEFPDNDDDLFQYHVGGESIATVLTHERSEWLIRVTTDKKAAGGWEQAYPIYTQSGLGKFCIPSVPIPKSFEGKTGIVSVVSKATDGILYQCVLAKFVSGVADEFKGCSNGSANGYFSDDDKLSALVGDSSSGGSSSESASPSESKTSTGAATSETSAAAKDDDGAAMSLQAWGTMSSLVTVAAMALAGGALLI